MSDETRTRGNKQEELVGGERSATAVIYVDAALDVGAGIYHGDGRVLESVDHVRVLAARSNVHVGVVSPTERGSRSRPETLASGEKQDSPPELSAELREERQPPASVVSASRAPVQPQRSSVEPSQPQRWSS